MMYVKSLATGQIYKTDRMPKFGGYVLSSEEEFNAYCLSKGIDPKTV